MSSLNDIKFLASDKNIDVLCLGETWLSDVTSSEHVNIPNFTVFRYLMAVEEVHVCI